VLYTYFGINIREKRYIIHKNPPHHTFIKKHANKFVGKEGDFEFNPKEEHSGQYGVEFDENENRNIDWSVELSRG
jgi:hypothetical protein